MINFGTFKSVLLNKRTTLSIRIFVPAVILFYLFHKLDLSEIIIHILEANPWIFLLSFGILCFRNFIGAYRSSILLKFKQLHYSIPALSKYYFIGNFFNLFLPAVIGRDIARGYYLYKTSLGKKETISSIVVERFIGTAALMLLSLFSILLAVFLGLNVIQNDVIKGIIVAFGLLFLLLVLFFYKETGRFIERLIPAVALTKMETALVFIRDVIAYNRSPVVLWYTFLSSLAFQFCGVISTYLIAVSLECSIQFIYFLILLPVIWFVGMLPISIGGLGVREGSFVFLFSTTGMPEEMAMAICILWLVQNVGLGFIGGVLFVLEGNSLTRIRKYRTASMDQ